MILLLIAALLVFAPEAGAATVNSPNGVTVEIVDSASESNSLDVVFDRRRQSLRVVDARAPLQAQGTRCQSQGPSVVECFIRDSLTLRVDAGGGDDRVVANVEAAVLRGGPGDDRLEGGDRGFVELHGDDGDDLLRGGRGPDMLDGGEGLDRLRAGGGSDDIRAADDDPPSQLETIGCGTGADSVLSFDDGDIVGASCESAFVDGVRIEPPRYRSGRVLMAIGPGEFEDFRGIVRVRSRISGGLLASGSFGALRRGAFAHRLSLKPTAAGRRALRTGHPQVTITVAFRGRRGATFRMNAETR